MGFFSGVGRIVIVVLNVVFVSVSLVLLASGMVLKFLPNNEYVKGTEDQIKEALKELLLGTGHSAVSLENFSLAGTLGTVAIYLIVIGVFLLFVAFCGCCGACCKVQTLLIIYACVLIFLLVGEISMVIVIYESPVVKDMVRTELISSLTNYKGLAGANLESLLWNGIMRAFKCCGVNNYWDFNVYPTHWNRYPVIGGSATIRLMAPVACCETIPTIKVEAESCALFFVISNSEGNYMKGCLNSIWDKFFDNPTMLGIVLAIAFAIQILLIFFTVMVYRENKKNKVNPGFKPDSRDP